MAVDRFVFQGVSAGRSHVIDSLDSRAPRRAKNTYPNQRHLNRAAERPRTDGSAHRNGRQN